MRLLVGFDGSDGGHDALELARALTLGGDKDAVLVVTARPTGSAPGGSP
jgi:nucleotide-binding universal stress UspA family protein